MNLMVSGGTEAKNIGIHFVGATDNGMLSNIIGINLHTGVKIEQAKNMQIVNCWVCELPNSIELIGGENILVKNCQCIIITVQHQNTIIVALEIVALNHTIITSVKYQIFTSVGINLIIYHY